VRKKLVVSLSVVLAFWVFSCFAVKPQDVSVIDSSTVTSFPLVQNESPSGAPESPQAASSLEPDSINEACLFKGGTCAPYLYDTLYDLLDRKSFLALGATSKTERTHTTRVLMLKEPRLFHIPQWQDGPVPKEELETYQWTDAPLENTFLNYVFNRSVWEAQRQVFRTIYRIEKTKYQREWSGRKVCQKRYIVGLQNIASRFDDPRFRGMTSVSAVREVFKYLSFYLKNEDQKSLSGLPFLYQTDTAVRGVNLPERNMALFMEHIIRFGFCSPTPVPQDWRESIRDWWNGVPIEYYPVPALSKITYYDEPPTAEQRSVVELFEESSRAHKALAVILENSWAVPSLHSSQNSKWLREIVNGNIFPVLEDSIFMDSYTFFHTVWKCDAGAHGLPEIVYKVVNHNKLHCGQEWGSEGLYKFLQTIDHLTNLPKEVWGDRSAHGNRIGRQKDPIPESDFKNKAIIIKLLELAVEISEMMVQGRGFCYSHIAACAYMDLWMEDNTRIRWKKRHDELVERLKNPATFSRKKQGFWERLWGGNGQDD